jgi:hypothetical protein
MPIDTIILPEGGTFWIPKGATILSQTSATGITVSSPSGCVDTTIAPKKCWKFSWEKIDNDTDYNDAFFKSMEINGVSYGFNLSLSQLTYNTPNDLITEIPRVVPSATVETSNFANNNKTITVSLADSFPRPLLLWDNTSGGNTQYSAILGELVTCAV